MTILVTGGSGLVGSSLKNVIGKNDIDIAEVIFLSSKSCNLCSEQATRELFQRIKPTIVVHLAARVGGVYANLDNNYDFLMDNVKMNNNIVQMCKEFNVGLLINVLSTCIFPNENIEYPITSDQLHNGLPHYSNIGYAYAKRLLQVSSKLLADLGNTKVVNLTPTNLYGFNDNYNLVTAHVIPALIHKVYLAKKNNRQLTIPGDGSAVRQFLYAEDLGRVIVNFIETRANLKKYSELIVAPPSESEISIRELLEIIIEEFDFKGLVIYDTTKPNGQHRKTVDSSELSRYIPEFTFTDLKRGLGDTIKYFIENYNVVRK